MHVRRRPGAVLLLACLLSVLAGGGLAAGPAGATSASTAGGPVAAPAIDVPAIAPATRPSEVPYSGRLLGPGLVGDDVRQLQAFLNTGGARLRVDGIYGPRTARAVRQLQRRIGVVPDGIVGPATWSRGLGVAVTAAPQAPAATPSSPTAVAPPTSTATTAAPSTTAAPGPTSPPTTPAPATIAAPVTTAIPVTTAAASTTAAPVTTAPAPTQQQAASPGSTTEQEGNVWIVVAATLAMLAALVAIAVIGRRRHPAATGPVSGRPDDPRARPELDPEPHPPPEPKPGSPSGVGAPSPVRPTPAGAAKPKAAGPTRPRPQKR